MIQVISIFLLFLFLVKIIAHYNYFVLTNKYKFSEEILDDYPLLKFYEKQLNVSYRLFLSSILFPITKSYDKSNVKLRRMVLATNWSTFLIFLSIFLIFYLAD
jgi:hypothetical protein